MSAMLEIVDLVKSFPVRNAFGRTSRRSAGRRHVSFRDRQGRGLRPGRRKRLGQIDHRPHDHGPDDADRRRHPDRWRKHHRHRPAPAPRRKVQMVFQNPGSSLNPRRTVGQSIAVPLEAQVSRAPTAAGADRRTARHGATARRISPSAIRTNSPAGRSSASPSPGRWPSRRKLVVLDEPTSALDVSVQAKVIDLLVDLGRQLDLTYLFISHDLSLMRNFADRSGFSISGKIVETGPTASVSSSTRSTTTRACSSPRCRSSRPRKRRCGPHDPADRRRNSDRRTTDRPAPGRRRTVYSGRTEE